MDTFCPGCGRKGRLATARPGMSLKCPACTFRWTLEPRTTTPPSGRGTQAHALDREPPLIPDDRTRLARWGSVGGIAILCGLALPVIGPDHASIGFSRTALRWPWDLWPKLENSTKAATGALALLAILLIVAARVRQGTARAVALLVLAVGTLVVHVVSRGEAYALVAGGAAGIGFPPLLLGVGVAATALAAANHLRTTRPEVSWPRFAAALAGVAGVLLYFLETTHAGGTLSQGIFESTSWTNAPAVAGALALMFTYLAAALLHLLPGPARGVSPSLSTLGRIAAVAIPVALAASPLIAGGPSSGDTALSTAAGAIKSPLLLVYPGLIVMGLALVVLAAISGAPRAIGTLSRPAADPERARIAAPAPVAGPGPSDGTLKAPAATIAASAGRGPHPDAPRAPSDSDPVATLRRKLGRLQAAYAEGLLTEEEYQSKRKSIVGDFEF